MNRFEIMDIVKYRHRELGDERFYLYMYKKDAGSSLRTYVALSQAIQTGKDYLKESSYTGFYVIENTITVPDLCYSHNIKSNRDVKEMCRRAKAATTYHFRCNWFDYSAMIPLTEAITRFEIMDIN